VELDLAITGLGAAGDGVAALPDGKAVYVARTLPGERICAQQRGPSRAALEQIVRASPDRVTPPCPHFAACGGCALQHMHDTAYADWKRDLLAQALSRAGFDTAVIAPLARTPPGARRRLDFTAARIQGGVTLGLHAQHSETLIDVHACPVLHPALVQLLPPLRALLRTLDAFRKRADIAINLFDAGPDIVLRLDAGPNATDRTKLAAFAQHHGVPRIACAIGAGPAEIAALLRSPTITFATTSVAPPPGAFLQASASGESAIVAAVLAGLPKRLAPKARIIELYAGIGTLSFPLATRARVQAYEGDPAAAAALRRAIAGARVTVTTRDLTRQPLQKPELAGAAVVVLDPPYAGAAAQMPPLAAARIPTIIYVSCNPATLARDAALLRAQNYHLTQATPIDQFLWSAQLESVCIFSA
jgi:23S rRNA (uracil1939-C5)-methyltransferase